MKLKKITAAVLAVCLAAGCAGCSKKDSSSSNDSSSVKPQTETSAVSDESKPETEENSFGEDVRTLEFEDLSDGVFMNIGGFDVSVDEYKYYFAFAKFNMDKGDNSYWEDDENNSKIASLNQQTLNQLFNAYTIYKLAADTGVQLDENETADIDNLIKTYKLYYEASYKQTNETFDDYLKNTCCTEEVFRETLVRESLQNKIVNKLYGEDFKTNHLSDYYCANYLQISPSIKYGVDENNEPTHMPTDFYEYLDQYTYTDAEKAAVDKLNEANHNKDKEKIREAITELGAVIVDLTRNGTSFGEFMDKYNMDGTQPDYNGEYSGQFIKSSSMPQAFSEAIEALEDNGVTDMMQDDYLGYIIGNKLPFDEEVFASQAVDIFMSDENYEYQGQFTSLTTETQKKMTIKINNKYADIDSSFASLPTAYDTSESESESETAEEN